MKMFLFHNRLIDPQTQVTRISVSTEQKCSVLTDNCGNKINLHLLSSQFSQFQLEDVCQFAAHQENGRLMGFVVEGRDWTDGDEEGEASYSAFVFESNTEGEKVDKLIRKIKNEICFICGRICTITLKSFVIFCWQICYTINLAKDITEAKKVTPTRGRLWK